MKLVFRLNELQLPKASENSYPILLYKNPEYAIGKFGCIGGTVLRELKRLGVKISNEAFDFLTIALSVTAADSMVDRQGGFTNWVRELNLEVPLIDPKKWMDVKVDLEASLSFLTGDKWNFIFIDGGMLPPEPIDIENKNSPDTLAMYQSLQGLNCVSLFSGGLDSAIGALDQIYVGSTIKPLLISHKYHKDKSKQEGLLRYLSEISDQYSRLALNFYPQRLENKNNETSMRGRSFNFLAMAIIGIDILRSVNEDKNINNIFIPENGYIALNPPLTRRRIGSLSTRTTHPFFLDNIEKLLNKLGFGINFINLYAYKTKGEMIKECKNQLVLKRMIAETVSCSAWHRQSDNLQCGKCVPCIIRRASIHAAKFPLDQQNYLYKDLQVFYKGSASNEMKDDLQSLIYASTKIRDTSVNKKSWVNMSGPLPQNLTVLQELYDVFERGLIEVAEYLESESVL